MFEELKKVVRERFVQFEQKEMFVVNLDRDTLFDAYLSNIAEDIRQEYNCSCCKNFIRNYGKVVVIANGQLQTLWDAEVGNTFAASFRAMKEIVENAPIEGFFRTKEQHLGVDQNKQTLEGGDVIMWQHFHHKMDKSLLVRKNDSIATIRGDLASTKQVFKRSLDEITIDALDTVLELIAQNSLYRGTEFKNVVSAFRVHKKAYHPLSDDHKEMYAWVEAKQGGRIRNSAIGTLLVNLSEGKELDQAVGAFEALVAPHNYKRPKALVTKSMIEAAEKEIKALGIVDSLHRRYAISTDIPVSESLFVNRDSSKRGSLFDELVDDVSVNPKTLKKVDEISVDKFISDVLPTATSLEVLLEGHHTGNFMSLIAPEFPKAQSLFKWDNGLSWDYNGNIADSVKERVKQAGGVVDGELRISLSWFNYDDLDLHVVEPCGHEIYYSQRQSVTGNGGLDVDMNAGGNKSRSAVENIIFKAKQKMIEGRYVVFVNNFSKNESRDPGYNVEVECQGELFEWGSDKSPASSRTDKIVVFEYKKDTGIQIINSIDGKASIPTKTVWNLDTNKFHKVAMLVNSPNHWGTDTGNKHVFFILEGAKNEGTPRGMFNEFLKPSLLKNKRVFEVLGSKLKVEDSDEQLSGLGFSSTQSAELYVKVGGKFTRTLKVKF